MWFHYGTGVVSKTNASYRHSGFPQLMEGGEEMKLAATELALPVLSIRKSG